MICRTDTVACPRLSCYMIRDRQECLSYRGDALPAKSNRSKSASQSKPARATKPASRKRRLKIAIAGFGTVGRSVAKLLCQEGNEAFELTHIFNRNVSRKKVDWVPPSVRWTESIGEV